MANSNYPGGTTYSWTTVRQNGLTQSYPPTTDNPRLVDASTSNRIVSASLTVSYEECTETVNKTFDCAIPNSDANGNTFPECTGNGGGFSKKAQTIRISPNPVKSGTSFKIDGLDSYRVDLIEIIDMSGNVKLTQKEKLKSIDSSDFSKGIHIIKIYTDKGIFQEKFIVK